MTELQIAHIGGKQTMIVTYDGLFESNFCDAMLRTLEADFAACSFPGELHEGYNPGIKESRDLHFSPAKYALKDKAFTEGHRVLENTIVLAFSSVLAHYRSVYTNELKQFSNINDTGFQVQKYQRNHGYFRNHVDSFPSADNACRVLSFILYLNTVEQGGETVFPLHELAVNPVAGRIVAFPSLFTHPHEGRPSYSDDKWIINTFITNTISIEEQQALSTANLPLVNTEIPATDPHDAPHTRFEDAFMHPHDDHDHSHNKINETYDSFISQGFAHWEALAKTCSANTNK